MAAAILALVAPETGVASLVVGGLGVAWLLNWAATLSKEELLVGGIVLAEGFFEGTTAATSDGLGLTGVDWAKPEGALNREVLFALKIDEVFALGGAAAATGVKAE